MSISQIRDWAQSWLSKCAAPQFRSPGKLDSAAHILAIGQSHLAAIMRAAAAMQKENKFPDAMSLSFMQLHHGAYNPCFQQGKQDRLNKAITRDLAKHLRTADMVVSCIGGNSHAALGLLNHPQPYDFAFDSAGPIIDHVEIVPRALVRAALQEQMDSSLKLFAAIRSLIDKPMLHCEPPPPIPSDSHVRSFPKNFADVIEERGVAPAPFRMKLWKLQSEIFREFCATNDIEFLPAPTEVLDEDGMLLSKAWAHDPTHGNAWYGKRVILQLAARAGDFARYRGGRG